MDEIKKKGRDTTGSRHDGGRRERGGSKVDMSHLTGERGDLKLRDRSRRGMQRKEEN
jgi:hypothetical protein